MTALFLVQFWCIFFTTENIKTHTECTRNGFWSKNRAESEGFEFVFVSQFCISDYIKAL